MMIMKRKSLILAVAAIFMPYLMNGQLLENAASKFDLKSSLVMDQKWVPYPSYDNRQGWDALTGEYKDSLIRQGEKYLNYDWKVLRATDYLDYLRSGSRYAQEGKICANANALSRVMIAELAEGKGRFLDDIVNGVFLFCEYTSWAVSDHLFKFQKSGSPIPDYKDNMMALLQGNHAQLLAWAYYFFHKEFDKMDPAFSERLEYEIRRKELEPYIQRDDFSWMGLTGNIKTNNWNPWCNSNALLCFMLIENDRDALFAGISKILKSLDSYISCIPTDGACDEGTAYWYKSAGNLCLCLECLEMITGGKLNVWDNSLIRHFGEFIVDANIEEKWQANFADAKPTTEPGVGAIYLFGKKVDSQKMRDYAIYYNKKFGYDPVDLDWTLFFRSMEILKSYKELNSMEDHGFEPSEFIYYPATELCYMRSGKGYLAVKGGNNKERHNHNDVGSCIYFYNSSPVLIDAGPGTYNKNTFDKRYRYKIWNMSSAYHNVPTINGFPQEYGLNFKASGTKADKANKRFTTDIAGAYPDSAGVHKAALTYRLTANGALEIITDIKTEKKYLPTELHFLVPAEPVLERMGEIGLNSGLTMHYNASQLTVSYDTIPLEGTGVSTAFGPKLFRIVLKAKSTPDRETYKLTICR